MKTITHSNYTPKQGHLPVYLQDFLPITDPVIAFDQFMEGIEIEKYLKDIPEHETGRIRYNPVDMLKTVLFGFMEEGYCSLRELEDKCKVNVYLVKDGTLFMFYGRRDFESMTSRKYEYVNGLNGHSEMALYVDTFEEVDDSFKKAVDMGASPVLAPVTEPWGQRTCYIADPEGNLIEIGSWNKPYDTKDKAES